MSVLKRNLVYNTALSVSQVLFPMVTFPYASRVLGPPAMGAISFADNFTTYFLIFSALGIPMYGVREIAKVKSDPQLQGKLFSELLAIHLLVSLFAIFLLLLLSYNIPRLNADLALYHIGMSIILGSVFISEWFFQGIEKFRYIAIRTVAIRIFTIMLLFLMVRGPQDKELYYGLSLLGVLLSAFFNMYIISRTIRISFKGLSVRRHLRPLLVISSNGIVTTIYLVFDTIILGFLTNDITVGYYSTSMKISKLALLVIGAISAVLLPRLTIAFQNKDHDDAREILGKSISFILFMSIPIAIGTYCLAPQIITLFAGQDYLPAIGSLQILCFVVIFVGMAHVFSQQLLLPLHQERKILYASVIGMAISLSFNFALIPLIGQKGAAISSLSTEIIVTILLYVHSRKFFKLAFPYIEVMQCLVTSLLFFLIRNAVLQLTASPIPIVLITVSLSVASYLLIHIFVWKNKNVLFLRKILLSSRK